MFAEEGLVFWYAAGNGKVADAGAVAELARVVARNQASGTEVANLVVVVAFGEVRGRTVSKEIAFPTRPITAKDGNEDLGIRKSPFTKEDAIDDVIVALHEVEKRTSIPVDACREKAIPE